MQTSDYRLAPAFGARYAGALLVVLAVVLLLATVAVVVLDLPAGALVALAAAGLAGVGAAVYVVLRRIPVVRLGPEGYRVRLLRNAGADRAAWSEVTEAATASPDGTPVVVLRLQDGRATTIPVRVLAADREDFVRDLQAHLQSGHGLRPL